MPIQTRIFKNVKKSVSFLGKRFAFLSENFSISVLFLFIGFFIGNIFGTFLNWLREFIIWDGLLVFILLSFFEIISSIVYHNNSNFGLSPMSRNKIEFSLFFGTKKIFLKIISLNKKFQKVSSSKIYTKPTNQLNLRADNKRLRLFLRNLPMWRLLNCLKVGILFGFFVDAFKVGS